MLRRFAERRLDEAYPYLILDARYEKGSGSATETTTYKDLR